MLASIRATIAVQSAMVIWGAPSLSRVPLTFEPAGTSEFIAHSGSSNVILTPTGVLIGRDSMRLIGAQNNAIVQPEDLLPSYSNYLIGRDPRKWRTHVSNYRRIRYGNVYPGIDVVYYGNPRELEFDFVVAPGADPRRIRLALDDPDLRIRLPRVYQSDGDIQARVVRHGASVAFELAAYDRTRPLVIDPVLSFATIFGGGGSDPGRAIAVDSTGATYVAGNAGSGNFPVVNGNSGAGSFLAKVNSSGDALVYSTYLSLPVGGGSGSIAIDSSGAVYFAGVPTPNASGLPVVGPAPLGQCNAPGGPPLLYVGKLSSDGASLLYSGCITSSIVAGTSIVTSDGNGNAYIAGTTPPTNLPPRPVVLKLGPDGALLYSRLVAGSNGDSIRALAADSAGNIYLTGQTNSADFPIKNAIQARPPSSFAPFVAKIKADGSDYVYATYFGGSNGDAVLAIAADASGKTYLAGTTASGDFPTTKDAFQGRFDGSFLFKTTDAAKTWSRSDSGLPAAALFVQVDPQQPSTLYAVSAGGLFKSTDRGASWHGTSAAAVNSLWIDPVDSALYIGTTHGDFVRSRDAGATFTPLPAARGGNLNAMAFDPTNASVIYARWGGHGPTDGVYKSTDGGDTWKPTGLVGAMTGSGPLAIDPANPSTLYAEARSRGLVRSTDGGDTWTVIGADVNQIVVDSHSTLYTSSGTNSTIDILPPGGVTTEKTAPGSVVTLLIDPTNSLTWYATIVGTSGGGAGIYKSTDGGDTWQLMDTGLPSSLLISAMSLVLDPRTPQMLYLGTLPNSDGFFATLSPDGASLQYSTYLGGSGVDAADAIAVDTAGNSYIAGTTNSTDFPLQNPFRQNGSGFAARFDATNKLVWSSLLGGAAPTAIALGSAGEVYLTGSASSADFPTAKSIQRYISSNFFYSGDGGTTWIASSPTGGASPPGSSLPPVIAIDPKTPSRVYELADRLYVSNDRGQSWTPLGTPGFPFTWAGSGPALLLDPLTPTTIYAAGMCQNLTNSRNCGVSKSTDGGLTWAVSSNSPPVPGANPPITMLGNTLILGLAIDPKTPSNLYASTGFGIFKSTDGAATWNPTGSLGGAGAVAVDPLNSAVVYASVGNTQGAGIYRSSDAGATFTAINNGLPFGWFANSLVLVPSVPGRVYAIGSFAPTNGVYRTDDSGNTWMKVGSGLPGAQVSALAVDPSNSSVVYAAPSAGGLYRSTDAGATFSLVPGLRIPIVSSLAIDPTNSSQIYTGSRFNPSDAFVMKIVQ